MPYYPYAIETGGIYSLVTNGVTAVFNDPIDPNYVGMLTEVTGLDSAEVRDNGTDLVEADGGSHGAFFYSRRPIVMNASVFGHATVKERAARIDKARRASNCLRGDGQLSWAPSLANRSDNLFTNPKPTSGGAAWTYLNGTGAIATDGTSSTGNALTLSAPTTTDQFASPSSDVGVTAMQHGVRAGDTITVSADINANAAALAGGTGSNPGIFILYRVAGNVFTAQTEFSGTANTWTRISTTFTIPSNATGIGIRFYNRRTGAVSSGAVTKWAGMRLTRNGSTAYVDGDTAGNYWYGTASSAQSGDYLPMFTTVRRQQPFREAGGWVKNLQIPLVSEYAFIFNTSTTAGATGTALENRGSAPAYPLINITGASTNPSVAMTSTGFSGTLTFTTTGLTLAAGETVQFDMFRHTGVFTAGARNGQGANRYIDFATTQWPYLEGNGYTQTFTLGGGGSASLTYRDTWA